MRIYNIYIEFTIYVIARNILELEHTEQQIIEISQSSMAKNSTAKVTNDMENKKNKKV